MPEEELIQEQIKKLPAEVWEAIGTVPWIELMQEISLASNLSKEQAENLIRETMFIIYGFENPAEYTDKLIKEVAVDEGTAVVITEQVIKRILKPISNKIEGVKKSGSNILEATPDLHPMIEPGEVAHEVPHQEPVATITETPVPTKEPEPKKSEPASAPVPPAPEELPSTTMPPVTPVESKPKPPVTNSAYSGGLDPYREPIE